MKPNILLFRLLPLVFIGCSSNHDPVSTEEQSSSSTAASSAATSSAALSSLGLSSSQALSSSQPPSSSLAASSTSSASLFVDPRDGQSYQTTAIGNQVWMAQNLNPRSRSWEG